MYTGYKLNKLEKYASPCRHIRRKRRSA